MAITEPIDERVLSGVTVVTSGYCSVASTQTAPMIEYRVSCSMDYEYERQLERIRSRRITGNKNRVPFYRGLKR